MSLNRCRIIASLLFADLVHYQDAKLPSPVPEVIPHTIYCVNDKHQQHDACDIGNITYQWKGQVYTVYCDGRRLSDQLPAIVRSFHIHCIEPELRRDHNPSSPPCSRLRSTAPGIHYEQWRSEWHKSKAILAKHRGEDFLSARDFDWRLRIQAQAFLLLKLV